MLHPFKGQTIIGSGLERGVLLKAGIERVDGLAAATNSDETNVVVARIARLFFQVPRVVARLYDPRKVEVYQRLGVQIVAPIPWAVNRFDELLSYSELEPVMSLGNGEVEIVQMEAPSLLVGRKVSAISVPGEIQVVAINRKGRAFLPTLETMLQRDDWLQIALLASSIERLRAMLALT
jgi:trk system potassium uptake protein TrkA